MVVELLITLFFNIFEFLLSLLPAVPSTAVPNEFSSVFYNIIYSVAYFLPLGILLPLVVLSISLDVVNITWKFLMRVKSFIPTMGD